MNDALARQYMESQRELCGILSLLWEEAEPDEQGGYVIRVDLETARLIRQALGMAIDE